MWVPVTSAALMLALALPALAEGRDVPDYDGCLDRQAARFERDLRRHKASPFAGRFTVGDDWATAYCQDVGRYWCDQAAAPVSCLVALTDRQEALREVIFATLPAPDQVQAQAGGWATGLYPRMWLLAQDRSAGPDCGGLPAQEVAQCEAYEAGLRLGVTVGTWHLARYLDVAPDAVSAGWAKVPPPTRPRLRPEKGPAEEIE